MHLKVGLKNFEHGTSINDVEVPDQLRRRRMTGIGWFDSATGGLVPSTIFMLTGDAGAGKTTLLLQIASGLAQAGHIVLLNTGEESLYQVKMVSERLNSDGNFYVGQDLMVGDVISHANMLRAKNPLANNNEGKQVFILQDSLPALDDGFYKNGTNSKTPVRCCEILTNWAKETFGIVIFINHVTKGGQFAGKQKLKHVVDGHLRLCIDQDRRSDNYGERVFIIDKNRFGSSQSARVLGMNETGIYEKFVVQSGAAGYAEPDDSIVVQPPKKPSGVFKAVATNVQLDVDSIKSFRRGLKH